MRTLQSILIQQAHIVWVATLVNVSIGFFISDFNAFTQSISAVGLESAGYAYTHRAADILIGMSMCAFGIAISLLKRKVTFSLVLLNLYGVSMISAGVWTLESPLHLLYNLSIVMILTPAVCALELKEEIGSLRFERFSISISLVHVSMFWFIYAGFMPQETSGLINRIWAVVGMSWFGIAAFVLSHLTSDDEQVIPDLS